MNFQIDNNKTPLFVTPEENTNEVTIPDNVLHYIFELLPEIDLAKCAGVSRQWRAVSSLDSLWIPLCESQFGGVSGRDVSAKKIFSLCQTSNLWKLDKTFANSSKINAFIRKKSQLIFSDDKKDLVFIDNVHLEHEGTRINNAGKFTQMTLNNHSLILAGWDNDIAIWNVDKKKCIQKLKGHERWLNGMERNGKELITLDENGEIRSWDLDKEKSLKKIASEHEYASYKAICGDQLIIASNDRSYLTKVNLVNETKRTVDLPEGIQINGLISFNNHLISAHDDLTLNFWDKDLQKIELTKEFKGLLTSTHKTGKCLVTGHENGSINLWKLPSLEHVTRLEVSQNAITLVERHGDEITAVDDQGIITLLQLS